MGIINNGMLINNVNQKLPIVQNQNVDRSVSSEASDNSFQNILSGKISENESLRFSKHANLRLYDRNLNLTQNQMERVQNGVNEARTKGVTDSLVLVDDIALVVSVKNNTVITATNKNQSNIFTNINGAVIV